jgi:hypothetical protein
MKYSLRSLFAVTTAVAVALGIAGGILRFSQYMIMRVEADYWSWQIREGLENPHDSPARFYLSPKEIDSLSRERKEVFP